MHMQPVSVFCLFNRLMYCLWPRRKTLTGCIGRE